MQLIEKIIIYLDKRLCFRVIGFSVLLTLLMILEPSYCFASFSLPDSKLAWKNRNIDGHKLTVYCLYSDSRGLVWQGTNNGLYMFDGVASHNVGGKHLEGFQIFAITEKDDVIYLGTNNGLYKYEFKTGKILPLKGYSPKEIRSLLWDNDKLWIGGLYGIYVYDSRTGNLVNHSEGLPDKSVYSILRDGRGIIYVGTYNGLARWDSSRKRFTGIPLILNSENINNIFVNCLIESDDSSFIYVGSGHLLLKYFPSTDRCENVPELEGNVIKCIAKSGADHLIIGTDNGLFDFHDNIYYQYRHDSRNEQTLADNEIWSVYVDSKNNIWAGHERGFSIASGSGAIRTVKLSTLSNSGEGNEIHSILRDGHGRLWLGGTNGVMCIGNDGKAKWYRHSESKNSLSNNRVRLVKEDSANHLWVLTDGGLNRYNPEDDNFDIFYVVDKDGGHRSNWVYAMEEDSDHYWIGAYLGGLHYIDKSKFGLSGATVTADKSINSEHGFGLPNSTLSNDLVNNVIKDNQGNIWVLLFRDNILLKYNDKNKKLSAFNIYNMTGGYPSKINIDNKGRIWCAFDSGAIMFKEDGKSEIIRFPNTNSSERIEAIGNVGEDVWISTQSNIWKVNGDGLTATLLPLPQKVYTAIYQDKITGNVLLGGIDEILEVDPRKLENAVELRSIKMVVKDTKEGELDLSELRMDKRGMTIPYGGKVTLVVSTLDYGPESISRYLYKLAKDKTDTIGGWVVMPEGANTITLSDLKMGDYEILVKNLGSPGAPLSIPLKVERPVVLSWWAISLYTIAGLLIIACIIIYMRRRSARVIQEEERKKTVQMAERRLNFLTAMSHDLKTPLSMIMGPVSLLKEKTENAETKRSLDIVYDNAVQLNNMIHRTLELHELNEDDEWLLINSVFDVVEFSKVIFERFKSNNPRKNFIFHASCDHILIEADAVKFESIITNLLSNSCKYSEDGSTVMCCISRKNNVLELVVSDDGLGISDKDRPYIFKRMFRASSTSKSREGSGIGLYLIKKYLEKMGGSIELTSKEGEGSSFLVSLPIHEKSAVSVLNDSNRNSENLKKVLIVEDNSQISTFVRDLLNKEYTCLIADNGRSGLAIAQSFNPDIIILDEMMPIMNGMEMAQRLKQIPRLTTVPVIMLTARNDNRTENESVQVGIDIFMSKPFDPGVLLGRIKQLLRKREEIQEDIRKDYRIRSMTDPKPIEAESIPEKQLALIAKVIEENYSDIDLNVNFLCEKCEMSHKHLYRILKKYIGMSPLDYIQNVRLQKAAILLKQHHFTVSEVCYMVGFKTPSYFTKCFTSKFGVNPSQYESSDITDVEK